MYQYRTEQLETVGTYLIIRLFACLCSALPVFIPALVQTSSYLVRVNKRKRENERTITGVHTQKHGNGEIGGPEAVDYFPPSPPPPHYMYTHTVLHRQVAHTQQLTTTVDTQTNYTTTIVDTQTYVKRQTSTVKCQTSVSTLEKHKRT